MRQFDIQQYFYQEPVRSARGGSEVDLYLAGSPGNGLAVKIPKGPQSKIHRTIRRHTSMKHIGGGLVIPFEHLDRLIINPINGEDPIAAYNPIVQELVAQEAVGNTKLCKAVHEGDTETIKKILNAVIKLREELLKIGVILIDPIPQNIAMDGDNARLLDISATETFGRDNTIRRMSSLFGRLHDAINIFHYRTQISGKLRKALGNDWESFKRGMRQFHDRNYVANALADRSVFRARRRAKSRRNGSPDRPVPNVKIPA